MTKTRHRGNQKRAFADAIRISLGTSKNMRGHDNDTRVAKYWALWENGKKSEEKFGKKLVSSLKGSRT